MKKILDTFTGHYLALKPLLNYPSQLGIFARVAMEKGIIDVILDFQIPGLEAFLSEKV